MMVKVTRNLHNLNNKIIVCKFCSWKDINGIYCRTPEAWLQSAVGKYVNIFVAILYVAVL
jgi:hypothetical protein